MTKPDLTDEDYSDLAKLVREAIDAEPYRVGPRIKKLRGLLAKLDPASTERAVTRTRRRDRVPSRASYIRS